MKKFILILAILTLCPVLALATGPYLTCDSYPKTAWQPTFFMVTLDSGTPINSPAKTNTDGSVTLWYDLTAITVGNHTVSVTANDVWGASTASPFSFSRPAAGVATVPKNLTISQ